MVHHAVDAQSPAVGGHLRHDQRSVDPVEVGIGDPERGYPGDTHLDAGRQRRFGPGRCGKPDGGPGRLDVANPPAQPPADPRGHCPRPGDRGGQAEELPPGGPGGAADQVRMVGVTPAAAHRRGTPAENPQGEGGGNRAADAGKWPEHGGVRAGGRGQRGERTEGQHQPLSESRAAHSQQPAESREHREYQSRAGQQDGLVVGAKRRDRGVLQPGRHMVHKGAADRDQRRGGRGDHPGQ